MANLPYACYSPADIPPRPSAPSAVGSIRLDLTSSPASLDPLLNACSLLNANSAGANDKATKKALSKTISSLASSLLASIGDPSVCYIEVALPNSSIIASDGLIASSLMDVGAHAVVIDVTSDLTALAAARVPAQRVTASCSLASLRTLDFTALKQYANTVSVSLSVEDTGPTAPTDIRALVPAHFSLTLTVPPTTPSLSSLIAARALNVRTCITGIDSPALGHLYAGCAVTDRPDGLFTTVVATRSGVALGLVYSSVESIAAAVSCGRGVYYSRSRNGLWRKGDTSGCYQVLHRLDLDCDGDALRVMVTQMGTVPAFCHLETLTCWGDGNGVNHLEKTLKDRLVNAAEGSYTQRLFNDDTLLRNKLVEEAQELAEATEKRHVAEELADVLYFSMVRAVKAGVSLDDAVSVLDERSRKVTRRKGDDKLFRIDAAAKILDK